MHKRTLLVLFFNFFLTSFIYSRSLPAPDSIPLSKSGWRYNSRIFSLGIGNQNTDFERFADLKAAQDYSISAIKSSNPFYAKIEFFAAKHFGIGAAVNFNAMHFDYSYKGTNTNNQTVIVKNSAIYEAFTTNVRVNYHFFYGKKIDFYLGAATGLRIVGSKNKTNLKEFSGGFAREGEITAGFRYLVDGIFGVYMEAGLTRSVVQGGLSFNLNRQR